MVKARKIISTMILSTMIISITLILIDHDVCSCIKGGEEPLSAVISGGRFTHWTVISLASSLLSACIIFAIMITIVVDLMMIITMKLPPRHPGQYFLTGGESQDFLVNNDVRRQTLTVLKPNFGGHKH